MADPIAGESPFVIDGAGRVVRAGDDVIVVPRRSLFASSGPGVMTAVIGDQVEVTFPFHEKALYYPAEIHRADDHERTPDGNPLWTWL